MRDDAVKAFRIGAASALIEANKILTTKATELLGIVEQQANTGAEIPQMELTEVSNLLCDMAKALNNVTEGLYLEDVDGE